MNYRIVPMEECHIDGALRLERENFSDPWGENDFIYAVNDKYTYYVAVLDDSDEVIGISGIIIAGCDADIMNVSVSKNCRRCGIGKAMLLHLIDKGRELGVENFTLEVRVGNTPARTLYESLGFVSEGIRPRFYSNPTEDAAIYWLRKEE